MLFFNINNAIFNTLTPHKIFQAIVIVLFLLMFFVYIFFGKFFMTSETHKIPLSKAKLLAYALISSVTFALCVMPQLPGISIPVFTTIQFICLFFILPNKKRLLWFIPIGILSLNYFIYANTIWHISNFIVILFLYACMLTNFNLKDTSMSFFKNILNVLKPFKYIHLPLKWTAHIAGGKAPVIKRTIIALFIALPFTLVLTFILTSADMVFSAQIGNFFTSLMKNIKFNTIYIIICGKIAGLYLFGMIYSSFKPADSKISCDFKLKVDPIIINILLVSILFVYSFFVIIQFKYLFAGSTLPYGLTYTEYARKGFFELFFLTGINITLILLTVKISNTFSEKCKQFTKILSCYLCFVTIILLISSFYRMHLYTSDDGLTRLRFLVMGFLIFEGIGLLITLLYIIKPKFNIISVYLIIALSYYCILNITPMDTIIAKNQISKYESGKQDSISYVLTLSPDAAPVIYEFSLNNPDYAINSYFTKIETDYSKIPHRWQRYNISIEKALKLTSQ